MDEVAVDLDGVDSYVRERRGRGWGWRLRGRESAWFSHTLEEDGQMGIVTEQKKEKKVRSKKRREKEGGGRKGESGGSKTHEDLMFVTHLKDLPPEVEDTVRIGILVRNGGGGGGEC